MKKKAFYITRLVLVWAIALQLLNLSIDSQAYWDSDTQYDYSYAYYNTYDPTESAVEWIIEMNCGQQERFNYDNRTDPGKNIIKSFHWQVDLFRHALEAPCKLSLKTPKSEEPGQKIPMPSSEIISPPPDSQGIVSRVSRYV